MCVCRYGFRPLDIAAADPVYMSWWEHDKTKRAFLEKMFPRGDERQGYFLKNIFQIGLDTSRKAWNRHWGFMVDTGILSNNMQFPSHKCSITFWSDHIQCQLPTDQTLYRTRPFIEFWEVSIEHLRRVWDADRGRFLLQTPGPVSLGLAYVLLVEINPFSELVVISSDYAFRISLSTFSILLADCLNEKGVKSATQGVCM